VIGGGLAGSEAAWQLVRAGLSVQLVEARPAVVSPAHRTLLLGELVCSNSLRSDSPGSAPELLKAEMRRAGSLILQAADAARVPAGSALAVDRTLFAWRITSRLVLHRRIQLQRRSVEQLPSGATILASGPLTSAGLSTQLSRTLGSGFYFYDAIAPIVDAETIDWSRVFHGARRDPESQDYVNCPLNRTQYDNLVSALRAARQVIPHSFEEQHYFEGCLPLEVMAARGDDVLAHGPLRPVGLTDPRTGKRPFAVVQLRAENQAASCFNLVGFQTRLVQREQRRVFRMIPGLERVRFLRYGSIHRNTYIDAPRVLGPRLELRSAPWVMVAGQMTGVEGYLESAAMGLMAGLFMVARIQGRTIDPPPLTTALGALVNHVTRSRATQERFEPSNITFGLLPSMESRIRKRKERRLALRERALEDLQPWLDGVGQLLEG
jgi:methylenetetrahydrofolate--tRNA-(uracil-5-)-methyltransferase